MATASLQPITNETGSEFKGLSGPSSHLASTLPPVDRTTQVSTALPDNLSPAAKMCAQEIWQSLSAPGKSAFVQIASKQADGTALIDKQDINGVTIAQHLFAISRDQNSNKVLNGKTGDYLSELLVHINVPSTYSQKNTPNCELTIYGQMMLDEIPAEFVRCQRELLCNGQNRLPGKYPLVFEPAALNTSLRETGDPRSRPARIFQNSMNAQIARARGGQFDISAQETVYQLSDSESPRETGLPPEVAHQILEWMMGKKYEVTVVQNNSSQDTSVHAVPFETASALLERTLVAGQNVPMDVHFNMKDGSPTNHVILTTKVSSDPSGEKYLYYRDPHGASDEPIGTRFKGGLSELVDSNGTERVRWADLPKLVLRFYISASSPAQ